MWGSKEILSHFLFKNIYVYYQSHLVLTTQNVIRHCFQYFLSYLSPHFTYHLKKVFQALCEAFVKSLSHICQY